jgi:hypothetical protein
LQKYPRLEFLRMSLCMKAIIYAQLQPVKTLRQFMSDRRLYRTLILAALVMTYCF